MLTLPRKSNLLQALTFLSCRCTLSKEDESIFYAALQGYEGEREFSAVVQQTLRSDYFVLYDIFLNNSGNHYQLDCLIICERQIYLLEIKYYQGDYYFKNNDLYRLRSKQRIKNPFYQLQRSEDLLRDLLQKYNLEYTINAYVVFNHPSFTLYHALVQTNMILPTQISRFLQKLNRQPIHITEKEDLLVDMFYRQHIKENHFERLPEYNFTGMKKGIFCLVCRARLLYIKMGTVQCDSCLAEESIDSAVLRSVVEFNFLFPEVKINTSKIHEWCNGVISQKVVRRVLRNYLSLQRAGRSTHYEFLE